MTTMGDMVAGQSAIIHDIDANAPGVVSLMILGFVEGVTVTCRNVGFGGSSREFEMYGTRTCVPADAIKHFYVKLL